MAATAATGSKERRVWWHSTALTPPYYTGPYVTTGPKVTAYGFTSDGFTQHTALRPAASSPSMPRRSPSAAPVGVVVLPRAAACMSPAARSTSPPPRSLSSGGRRQWRQWRQRGRPRTERLRCHDGWYRSQWRFRRRRWPLRRVGNCRSAEFQLGGQFVLSVGRGQSRRSTWKWNPFHRPMISQGPDLYIAGGSVSNENSAISDKDKVGVVRPGPGGTALFSLDTNGNGAFDPTDAVFTFGMPRTRSSLVTGTAPAPTRSALSGRMATAVLVFSLDHQRRRPVRRWRPGLSLWLARRHGVRR